ncbi:MAG: SWI/SNF complex component snf12 [Watsoniomyces obsoletus]|nr:MAG: SWI/SNF complex component snf12 [Watsoniomyces obsoletus]
MFVARDVWMALTHHSNTKVLGQTSDFRPFGGNESLVMSNETRSFLERTGNEEVMRFAGQETVPMWLAYLYLGANIALTGLNWWWFEKMISAVRKRFSPAKDGEKDIRTVVEGEKGDGEGEKMENGGLGDIGSGIENDLGKREREDSGGSGSGNGGVMKEEEGEEIIVRKGGRVLEVLSSSSIHGSSSSPVVEPTRSNSRPRRRHG